MTDVANVIGDHKWTVSRDIWRNAVSCGYRSKQARTLALQRRNEKARFSIEKNTWQRVKLLLNENWSPEQLFLWSPRQESKR